MPAKSSPPPVVVIFGAEEHGKSVALRATLNELLPPEVERALALSEYDGERAEDDGGPSLAAVMDDLRTAPFLADRRVVVVREADKFVTAAREPLEAYAQAPAPTATLILCLKSFPKTTRLYKSVDASGGRLIECRALNQRGLIDFVIAEARARGKALDASVAESLVALVGPEQGALAGEVEKLALFAADARAITREHVAALVGLSREERIFAVLDAAALGQTERALELWRNTLATDPAAAFKATGGVAFVLRRWLAAHEMRAAGEPVHEIAPRVMMWRRAAELQRLLDRLPAARLKRMLARLAELDAQAKVGERSIEHGVEALLIQIASPSAA